MSDATPVQTCHGRDCRLPGCPACEAVRAYYERVEAEDDPAAARLAWYQAALRSTMRRLVRSNQVGARVAELADAEVGQLRAQRAAVLALHYRTVDQADRTDYVSCAECCGGEWPCPTARALGVTE